MNKLSSHTSTAIQTSDDELDVSLSWFHLHKTRRLIVLIPPDLDCATMARRIRELVQATSSNVQLLDLGKEDSQEPAVRRELVTLSALIQDARVPVEVKVEIGTNWLEAVKHGYHEGDMIVCCRTNNGIPPTLAEPNFGIEAERASLYPLGISDSATRIQWSFADNCMVGVFRNYDRLLCAPSKGHSIHTWLQTLLLILLLIPEFWLLWIWNSLLARFIPKYQRIRISLMIKPHDLTQISIITRNSEHIPRRSWRFWLIGEPVSTADAPHQTIGKLVGLAVFASDALSSTADAT